MTRLNGTIVRIDWKKNVGEIYPDKGGSIILFRPKQAKRVPNQKIHPDTKVEYEEGSEKIRGRQQIAAIHLTLPSIKEKGYRFFNPYNFVSHLPYRNTTNYSTDERMLGRTHPVAHDRWLGLSGSISCSLTTQTPLFVSDSEGARELSGNGRKAHYGYHFFRIGGTKAIPATTLRGVFRSAFETATNSCYANLGGERLSYRFSGRDLQKLIPARVEKQDKQWVLNLLPGAAPFDAENGSDQQAYAAAVAFYQPMHHSRRRRHDPPSPVPNPQNWKHRQKYLAVMIKGDFAWRVVRLFATQNIEEAQTCKQHYLRENSRQSVKLVEGWLCRTNQNTDNKHSERFFFRDNSVHHKTPQYASLSSDTILKYEDLINDYQTRHKFRVARRSAPAQVEGTGRRQEAAYSRFVLENEDRKLQEGDLVYARLGIDKKGLIVRFLAPVSWPRTTYDDTIADLLPTHMKRCDAQDSLCPACRTFGWVKDRKSVAQGQAYGGRVRLSHGLLATPETPLKTITLPILGSPKPTTTHFYLQRRRKGAKLDYIRTDTQLRGRKMYRHYTPKTESWQAKQSDQNRSIYDAEQAGARFEFSIEFENLTPVELGSLIWSLTLEGAGFHKLGYGKPLGMGSASVEIDELKLYDFEKRYKNLDDNDSWTTLLSKDEQALLVRRFQRAMITIYHPAKTEDILTVAKQRGSDDVWQILFNKDLPNINEMLVLLSKTEPTLPVHYPFSPDPNSDGSFEWFVGNKRLTQPQELASPTDDKGLLLVHKHGTLHKS